MVLQYVVAIDNSSLCSLTLYLHHLYSIEGGGDTHEYIGHILRHRSFEHRQESD
jgi:hypothetical protein